MWRIGTGFDVHALVEGRPLILGGLEIPHEKGLQGHSAADVLLHAVIRILRSATEGQIAANCCVMSTKWSENLASS